MCRDILGARAAVLSAVGSLAPLVPSLVYPDDANIALPTPNEIARFDSPQTMCVQFDAARWGVPLWSERGLIGVLMLGEKSDGGVYSQEEIEIARASGERLIDTRASAELARRLMALQRQRVAETQLLDQRARRVLHDDVLPQLHAAILALSRPNPQPLPSEGRGESAPFSRGRGEGEDISLSSQERGRGEVGTTQPNPQPLPSEGRGESAPLSSQGRGGGEDVSLSSQERGRGEVSTDAINLLTTAHRQISSLLRDLPTTSAPEVVRLGLVGALQRAVDEEWRQSFDRVTWDIAPNAERAVRALPSLTAETIFYAVREAIRNAARHGRGEQSARALNLWITVRKTSEVSQTSEVSLIIEDDGIGLHKTKLAEQGSGQGLALHSAMLAVVGGTLAVEPRAEGGTRVVIRQKAEG